MGAYLRNGTPRPHKRNVATKPPHYLPSKKPRARAKSEVVDPGRIHLELKNYLQLRRLVLERSLNPATREEGRKVALYLDYLRTIEHDE